MLYFDVYVDGKWPAIVSISNVDYLNYDKLIYLSKESNADIVIKDSRSGTEMLRIGKGFKFNKGD